ncbi:DUF2502 domain-containing protein [Shimwellia blattae]|uniref:DUF2502 domain-containing protein n=1 Tax=Shimwellia blattae (strain ATCC 29907 / DSM 4481 / JCM 1650 / NBRC 105725 / CDC 9005-74) TaxID=630626 RepID=I2B6S4_SHIBC|nr:DUF2502 domain-containing protein [Shimwellia blattae]AFJ46228.1 hypothetical protein EBL_c11240 [Shimwellia blattae DSM 4481 = NBRC 105725]GAB81134.1 hypothetical protein YpeC [Shimwellia blattae DSM 4481 = NBRC 105725]VDY63695.1 Protein of uncharacterised function (DUF2502) [Shimwellia blattae]VEC21823.1 Protein of uncharacterised function (DUF2502) [Shimwellia blattae]
MLRSLILAVFLLSAPVVTAYADEITLLPSIKLQIGDRDNYGNYWDGGRWRDRGYWHNHYHWRGDRWWRGGPPGRARGWDKHRAYERGYRDGWHDNRGRGRGHGHGHHH